MSGWTYIKCSRRNVEHSWSGTMVCARDGREAPASTLEEALSVLSEWGYESLAVTE